MLFIRSSIHKFLFSSFLLLFGFSVVIAEQNQFSLETDNGLFLGPKVLKKTRWVGNKPVSSSLPILVMAGHADSQGIEGSGTPGEAVALNGLDPMDRNIKDELFWNLKVRDAVVKIGKQRGLNIQSYEPVERTILDPNDKRTNWSVGALHAQSGGYPIEIHFDSFGKYGIGSGLIPPLSTRLNNVDESLARKFGRYPLFFRGGLGASRREIRILEVAKLEGPLENKLRAISSRTKTIDEIALQIVNAISDGINQKEPFIPELDEGDIFLPDFHQ